MIIELNKNGRIETFSSEIITGYMFRMALRFKERQEEGKLTGELVDEMAQFVCTVFRNQFTTTELYDGIKREDILETFNNVIRKIILGTSNTYKKH